MRPEARLRFLFWSFLKIGSTAFGGFMALISAVENTFVKQTGAIERDDMLDGISLASMLPGPIAVNVVAYVGYRLRGGLGALVSTVAVILPSFLLLIGLTIAYLRWGQLPAMASVFQGFIPAVCAVVVATAWNLGSKTIRDWRTAGIMVAALAAILWVGGFLVTLGIIAAGAVLGLVLFPPAPHTAASPEAPGDAGRSQVNGLGPLVLAPLLALSPALTGQLFAVFAGMSLMLFGGGYVFIPLIQELVVDGYGWVTQQEFIDAIAMGQVTPGPILISAAFIGYKVASLPGAISATVGIFLPSILLMLVCTTFFQRVKTAPRFQSALKGIRPAIIGMIVAAAFVIGRTAPMHWASVVIFVVALVALIRFRAPVAWVIPPAGLAGLLVFGGAA